MSEHRRIAIAMSGGVDSSVAAALLKQTGEAAFGLMLRLQDEDSAQPNRCCAPQDVSAARAVAATLEIPFYVVDARQAFEEGVVAPFLRGYAQGLTPNPCIECNRVIRFRLLLEHALALGATHLATGHYARIRSADPWQLLTALDSAKDQSYVLHTLSQRQLAHLIFPLGELSKPEVRESARRMSLPAAERPESQDLCFVARDYRQFLASRGLHQTPGPILDLAGNQLGSHDGLAGYTLGQRKGIKLAAKEPLYVIEKDVERNALIVGERGQVGRQQFRACRMNWIAGEPPAMEFDASVQVRYHAPRVQARIRCLAPDEAQVELSERNRDVAPGQAAVFYQDEVCLGGGIISL